MIGIRNSMKSRRLAWLASFSAVGALTVLAACSGPKDGDATGELPQDGTGSAHVTYQPNVRALDVKESHAALIGVSSDGAALLFDANNAKAQSWKAGDVLLLKGITARRVLAAETLPEGVLVLTQQASLTEVISDGQIRVDTPIHFGKPQTASIERVVQPDLLSQFIVTAFAGSPVSAAFKAVMEGWDTTWSATPSPGRTNLNLVLTKNVGGFIAKITGDGYLDDFDFSSAIDVAQSKTQRVDEGFKKLNGLMNFSWEVAKDSPGPIKDNDRIKLPGAVEIPLYQYLDGLPLFLTISAALIIQPSITGGKEYSHGAFRITYNGYQHFSAKEGNIDADGQVTGNIELLKSQNLSAIAPLGMVLAFAAPRIELSFGTTKILKMEGIKTAAKVVDALADQFAKRVLKPNQYADFKAGPLGKISLAKAAENAVASDATAYLELVAITGMTSTGMSVITPCTRTEIHLTGVVGTSAQVFGQDIGGAKSKKEIYRKDFKSIQPEGTHLCDY